MFYHHCLFIHSRVSQLHQTSSLEIVAECPLSPPPFLVLALNISPQFQFPLLLDFTTVYDVGRKSLKQSQ